jgi:HlyD family secretion protein
MLSRSKNTGWRAGRIAGTTLVLASLFGSGAYAVRSWGRPAGFDLSGIARTAVRRARLHATARAPGRVESAENTTIECELEAVTFASQGRAINTGGASTIIELIPDGSRVKKGDVLCRLDASDYEELIRQQEIQVQRARADLEAAKLDLESEKAGLREYRDGTLVQTRERFAGQIAVARADVQRQKERVEWTRRMVDIGYVPVSRLSAEKQALDRAQILFDGSTLALTNLDRFTAPKTTFSLESRVYSVNSLLTYQTLRLKRHEDRLAYFKEQLDHCTIRAPHDGFLIYANEDDGDTRIELGSRVRQSQDMFWLPDLSRMQVETVLAQSVVDRIAEGMPAVVRVESLPHVRLEGTVESVSPLPMPKTSWRQSDDVKNYLGLVALHVVPEGLRPGMTAEVEVLTSSSADALVVPHQAVTVEDGREVCYVAGPAGPERRVLEVGEVTPDALEVVAGLEEGEQVLLDPHLVRESVPPGAIVQRPAPAGPTQLGQVVETAGLAPAL